MLNFHRECWNPVKKHLKAFVFFAVSKKIPNVYSADRGRAEIIAMQMQFSVDTWPRKHMTATKFKQKCVSSINFFTQIKQNQTNMRLKIYYSFFFKQDKQDKQK